MLLVLQLQLQLELKQKLSDYQQTKRKPQTHDRGNKSTALQLNSRTWLANLCCQK